MRACWKILYATHFPAILRQQPSGTSSSSAAATTAAGCARRWHNDWNFDAGADTAAQCVGLGARIDAAAAAVPYHHIADTAIAATATAAATDATCTANGNNR